MFINLLFSDGDLSACSDFFEDGGDDGSWSADTSVGCWVARDSSFVHADSIASESHPVFHGCSEELTTFWCFIFS